MSDDSDYRKGFEDGLQAALALSQAGTSRSSWLPAYQRTISWIRTPTTAGLESFA